MRVQLDPNAIPHNVMALASALRSAGGRAFLVGGPIRDLLMSQTPEDWDIATDLAPSHVLSVFPSAVTVGIEFGRVKVDDVDVVSFRGESGYQDGRHPSAVSFGVSVEEDLSRRDFTVNAMAAEFPDLHVIDPFGGMDDLSARLIRAVGDARDRLVEDPLRILRAVRFKTVLGMNMEPSMAALLPQLASTLTGISGERTFAELKRILLAPGVYQGILDLDNYGLGQVVLPEALCGRRDETKALAETVSMSPPDLLTRLALLFHRGGRPAAKQAFARLNVESSVRDGVDWLLRLADERASGDSDDPETDLAYSARRIADSGGWENVQRLVDFELAAWRGQRKSVFPPATAALVAGMVLAKCRTPDPLALTGNDVMRITGVQGPPVGEALAFLWDLVLRDPTVNSKGWLERALREWWGKR